MALSDWTTLAIAGGVAIAAAAVILRTMSRPLTFAHHWQRRGDFTVFDALLGVGLKRLAKPGRLQLAVYVTLRKVPLGIQRRRTRSRPTGPPRTNRTRPARSVAADEPRLSPAET